ncbi:hypothetical protein PVAND_010083 [Polypedilum vanderplanki]|uniref:C2H2-type domain-containing protein n=1 Tax=Polypedilum vanderplanki TaxID=319348 RepID=A0A9J6CEN9_POLVA|nr:hypothetical protein PVAND_010083 [Polypedilum vanderplanki]
MENFIVKREDGNIVSNPAERNIILLRYAAFLNENENNVGIQQIQQQIHHTQAPQIQIIEQHVATAPPPTSTAPPKKSTKASAAVQNAQAANVQIGTNQKLSGLQCHLCSKVLCNSQYLNQHIRVVHENIREHGCSYCDMKFGSKSHLIIHERKHTGERPYTCEVCNKGFAQKSLYSYHKKRAHTSSSNQ